MDDWMLVMAGVILGWLLFGRDEKSIEQEVKEEIQEAGVPTEIEKVLFLNWQKCFSGRVLDYGDRWVFLESEGRVFEIEKKGCWIYEGVLFVNDVRKEYSESGVFLVNCDVPLFESVAREKMERKKYDMLMKKMEKIARIEQEEKKNFGGVEL